MEYYIPTGNEMLSLPKINEKTAGIEDMTFLYMLQKGMLEVRGSESKPLFQPFFRIKGEDGAYSEIDLSTATWTRDHYWIPRMHLEQEDFTIDAVILTPVEERGFAIRLSVFTKNNITLHWGIGGSWDSSWHCINEDKPLEGTKHCYESGWNDSLIFDYRLGGPLFSFAPMTDIPCEAEYSYQGEALNYSLYRKETLEGNKTHDLTFFWGIGFEEVASATSAKEMLRRGWQWEYDKTVAWLSKRSSKMSSEKLTEIYNTNLFFCIFYSTGLTLDTEELVCATSRSTRYYVSAAYWDRDTLLWAFPAILDADPKLARNILEYVFTRQRRNIGIHSRYIDGTVLEPGFELDELVAPIIALSAYVDKTKDYEILKLREALRSIGDILEKLEAVRDSELKLYETFLQPTDDEIVYPYITYNNVLVWKAFNELAKLYPDRYSSLKEEASIIRKAIYERCIRYSEAGKRYFAWSIDKEGRHDVYDEPPGSLQLLPYYGFCDKNDEIWKNTVAMIRSSDYSYSFAGMPIAEIGCPHAPYPWVLSICNSLLSGHEEQAFKELEIIKMDNGIACESVDAVTGVCTTGAAFATCAGFLCHSIITADKEE